VSSPLVALRCDAEAATGLGHLLRCLALAEALLDLGLEVVVVGSVDEVPLAGRLLEQHRLQVHAAPVGSLVPVLDRLGAAALVVDSYSVEADIFTEVRATGRTVVAVIDSPAPRLEADLLVNPNYGSERSMAVPHLGRVLAGVSYALLRGSVTRRRPAALPRSAETAHRVLVVLGGTDVLSSAAHLTERLLATGLPLSLDVVCATPQIRRTVERLPVLTDQHLRAYDPVEDLPALAAGAEVVVSAAGTTMWELACLGRPMALVTVADNQLPGYEAVVSAGLAVGLGPAQELASTPEATTASLRHLIENPDLRGQLATAGYAMVDGRGRDRVADAMGLLLGARR